MRGNDFDKWNVQSAHWRSELGVPKAFNPYTANLDLNAAGFGSRPCKRTLDLLDCAVLHVCKRQKKTVEGVRPILVEKLVDVSQSHARRPMSSDDNIAKALTTSSRLYSFAARRLLSSHEHFLLQGYPQQMEFPEEGVSDYDLRRMAGEGIALPVLASLFWALRLTKPLM